MIEGGAGADAIWGDGVAHTVSGAGGNDTIDSGPGSEIFVVGDSGASSLVSGPPGDDTITGADGDDSYLVGDDATLACAATISGAGGDDTLRGASGNDTIVIGDHNPVCGTPSGDSGDDFLFGDAGDDDLHGDSFTDATTLDSGSGTDSCDGGAGSGLYPAVRLGGGSHDRLSSSRFRRQAALAGDAAGLPRRTCAAQ